MQNGNLLWASRWLSSCVSHVRSGTELGQRPAKAFGDGTTLQQPFTCVCCSCWRSLLFWAHSAVHQVLGRKTPNKAPQKTPLRAGAIVATRRQLNSRYMPAKRTGSSKAAPWCWGCGQEPGHCLETRAWQMGCSPQQNMAPLLAFGCLSGRSWAPQPGPSTSEPIWPDRAVPGGGSKMSPLTAEQADCSSPSSRPWPNYSCGYFF